MMKGFSKYLLAGFLTMGLFACSENNDVPEQGGQDVADAVYMQFKLELPSVGGRSATDGGGETNSDANPDFEIGKDRENAVSSAYIVLAKADNSEIVAYQLLEQMGTAMNSGNTKIYTVEFESTELAVTSPGETLNVYAFCNPTTALTNIITNKGAFKDALETLEADNSVIWGDSKFLMANADNNSQITVPADWEPYYVKTNPFDLGVIAVERAAARFDYKTKNKDEIYTILNDKTGEEGNAVLQVQLTDVALVNMSKSFYYLRRVSDNGLNTNSEIGALETRTNYVVDTDADDKNGYTAEKWANKANNFFYNSDDAQGPSAWSWTALSAIDEVDNWEGADGNDGYKIWRYAIENTIPDPISNQKHGITTGVVFKGKLLGDKVAAAAVDRKNIYVYQNVLYGTAEELKTAAENGANPSLTVAYEKAMASATEGQTMDDIVNVGQYNFIRYKANAEGAYEMYYYYWNRHNDNNDPTIMGKMEFAVVRNNVYKLAVESISNYGHPGEPGDDPDPENPDTPDEEQTIYFKVSVKVLPWVVRVNNIEF